MSANLEIRNICFSWGQDKLLLDNISFSAHSGEVIAILGTNGAGKSTLLNIIAETLRPLKGSVMIDGIDIRSLPYKERARLIALLPQTRDSIPDMSVANMVLHGRYPYRGSFSPYTKEDYDYALKALETLDIQDLKESPIANLSGGQRQKVYLALCLAQGANVLLLDEPLNSLDIAASLDFMQILGQLAISGKTICVVLHDLALASAYTKRAIVLHKGNIVCDTPSQALLKLSIIKDVFGVESTGQGYPFKPYRGAHDCNNNS